MPQSLPCRRPRKSVTTVASVGAQPTAAWMFPIRPPSLLKSSFPRPSPQGTPEALPYPILRCLSRPCCTALHRAASRSDGLPRCPGGAAIAAGEVAAGRQAAGVAACKCRLFFLSVRPRATQSGHCADCSRWHSYDLMVCGMETKTPQAGPATLNPPLPAVLLQYNKAPYEGETPCPNMNFRSL